MKNLRALLVYDDSSDQALFQSAFDELDQEIDLKAFKSGTGIIDYLSGYKEVPDIIFLDLNTAMADGIDSLGEVRKDQRHKSVHIVVYSSSAAAEDIQESLRAGANGYLVKPESSPELKERISDAIRKAR